MHFDDGDKLKANLGSALREKSIGALRRLGSVAKGTQESGASWKEAAVRSVVDAKRGLGTAQERKRPLSDTHISKNN